MTEDILTLGICEYEKNYYFIVGYDIKFREIKILKAKNINFTDNKSWDIGAVTRATIKNGVIQSGNEELIERKDRKYMKELLIRKESSYTNFTRNNSDYAIIKVQRIKKIIVGNEMKRIEIISGGSTNILESKDIRWNNYWKYAMTSKKIDVEESKKRYTEFFNNKEVYFVLCKYKRNIKVRGYLQEQNETAISSILWF